MTVYEWMFETGYPLWLAGGLAVACLIGWVCAETERKWTEQDDRIERRRRDRGYGC
jgi:hypothetical protein